MIFLPFQIFLTLFQLVGGGGPCDPGLTFFGDISKSIGLRLFTFFDLLTYILHSPQAYCQNSRICTFSVFLGYKFSLWKFCKFFLHIWIRRVNGFQKCLSFFAHFLFLHIFCLIAWYCNKYLKFLKICNFFADD